MYCLVNDIYSAPGTDVFFNKSPVKNTTHDFVVDVKPREWKTVSPIPGYSSVLVDNKSTKLAQEIWHELIPVMDADQIRSYDEKGGDSDSDVEHYVQTIKNNTNNSSHAIVEIDKPETPKMQEIRRVKTSKFTLDSKADNEPKWYSLVRVVDSPSPVKQSLGDLPAFNFDYMNATSDYDSQQNSWSEDVCLTHESGHNVTCGEICPEKTANYSNSSSRELSPLLSDSSSSESEEIRRVFENADDETDMFNVNEIVRFDDPNDHQESLYGGDNWSSTINPYLVQSPEPCYMHSEIEEYNWHELAPVNETIITIDEENLETVEQGKNSFSQNNTNTLNEVHLLDIYDYENNANIFAEDCQLHQNINVTGYDRGSVQDDIYNSKEIDIINNYQTKGRMRATYNVQVASVENTNTLTNNDNLASTVSYPVTQWEEVYNMNANVEQRLWHELTPVNEPEIVQIYETENFENSSDPFANYHFNSDEMNPTNDYNSEECDNFRNDLKMVSESIVPNIIEKSGLSQSANSLKDEPIDIQEFQYDAKDLNYNSLALANLNPKHESTRVDTSSIKLDKVIEDTDPDNGQNGLRPVESRYLSICFSDETEEKEIEERPTTYDLMSLMLLYEDDKSILMNIEYDEKLFELKTRRKRLIAKNHLLETIHERLKVEIDLLCDIKNFFRNFLLENNEIDSFSGDGRVKETEKWDSGDESKVNNDYLGDEDFDLANRMVKNCQKVKNLENHHFKRGEIAPKTKEIDHRTISIDEKKNKFDAIYREIMGQVYEKDCHNNRKLLKNSDSTLELSQNITGNVSNYHTLDLYQDTGSEIRTMRDTKQFENDENTSKIPQKGISRFSKSNNYEMRNNSETIGEQLDTIKSKESEFSEFDDKNTLSPSSVSDKGTENYKLTAYELNDYEIEAMDSKSKEQLINRFKKHIVLLDVENDHLIDDVKRLRGERDYLLQVKTYYRSLL